MKALRQHLVMTIRLYFRNPMALLYGYLFPVIFLVAFWIYYITDPIPLRMRLAQLLAVTALSGVCFGLPTTLVSERERGVWRRYRLSPIPTGSFVASTIIARYLTTISAGLLQVVLAMALKMPMPAHPFQLFIAYSFVCWGFVGMGLVVSTMANNVPAVQALGQCLFLPLLMLGGVAVELSRLPDWAQHISAFFPGRFAVQAMDASIRFDGLSDARFSLVALTLIGGVAVFAGTKLFRWDAMQKFRFREGGVWIGAALASWIAIGVLAEWKGRVLVLADSNEVASGGRNWIPPRPTAPLSPELGPPPSEAKNPAPAPTPAPSPAPSVSVAPSTPAPATPEPATPSPTIVAPPVAATPAETPAPTAALTLPAAAEADVPPWKKLTAHEWWGLPFDEMPSDRDVVAPLAVDEEPDKDIEAELEMVRKNIPLWDYSKVADPVQRVRNLLAIPAVVDTVQWTSEKFMPWVIWDRLSADYTKDDLVKILTWIALHPTEGNMDAADDLAGVGVLLRAPNELEVRRRAYYYAVKFVAEALGKPRH